MDAKDLNNVLYQAYKYGFKVQSDFARENAQAVAALACLGMITTKEAPNQYGRIWRITGVGLETLRIEGWL